MYVSIVNVKFNHFLCMMLGSCSLLRFGKTVHESQRASQNPPADPIRRDENNHDNVVET